MTAKIKQNVTPRRQINYGFKYRYSRDWQRGSVSSATLSLLLGLIVIIGVASLSFFYLGQVLTTAVQGSDIQNLEERIVELKEKQRSLELEGAKLRSIESVENRVNKLNLVSTSQVTFMANQSGHVAVVD